MSSSSSQILNSNPINDTDSKVIKVTPSQDILGNNIASVEEEKNFVSFKNALSLEKRRDQYMKIKTQFPDKIPVIIERGQGRGIKLPMLKKKKYLINKNATLGEIVNTVIRPSIKLSSNEALYIFCNNELPSMSQTIGEIHHQFCKQDDIDNGKIDGFTYLNYHGESVFGTMLSS